MFTKEEIEFMQSIMGTITVKLADPSAVAATATAQSIMGKLNVMAATAAQPAAPVPPEPVAA
jgi:hypothetical protein